MGCVSTEDNTGRQGEHASPHLVIDVVIDTFAKCEIPRPGEAGAGDFAHNTFSTGPR
jgi:hypothetical protein